MTLSQKDIAHWSKYLSRRQFTTEQEARDFIFRRLEQSDHDHGSLFGVQGSEKNAAFAAAMPVYKLKTCWKVGRPSLAYSRKPKWTWASCTIRSTPHEELVQIAQANETANFTIKRKQFLPLRALDIQRSPAGDRYEGEARYIEQLARTIKQDEGWFECVVVGTYDMKEFWLIEGQHRARGTAWFLKMSTIPADVIWYDERTEESMKPAAFIALCEDAGIRIQRFTGDDEHYSDDEDAENSMGLDDSDMYVQAEEVFKACGLRVMWNRKLSFVALAADQKARFGEKVVGAIYSAFSNGHGDPDNGEPDEPFLDYTFDIAILPQYQGGLLGLQLIQAMLKEAKAEGGDLLVRCRNWVINPVAAKLLTHLGFEMESEGMPDGRYSAHMVKWL